MFSYYRRICAYKKPFEFVYGFKSQCTYVNESFYKLRVRLHSRQKNKIKSFSPFGNQLLPPSKTSLTAFPIMYPLRQKDICYCDPRCIISSSLMFGDIIMYIIRNNKLAHHIEEKNSQIENNIICI